MDCLTNSKEISVNTTKFIRTEEIGKEESDFDSDIDEYESAILTVFTFNIT